MSFTRRQFLKLSASGIGATSLGALGLLPEPRPRRRPHLQARPHDRDAQHLPVLLGGLRRHPLRRSAIASKNARTEIIHVEGDPDHPVNRGTLCPKGAALLDFVHSPHRLRFPEYRAPGSDRWERVTWEWALDRIARLMKDDRDKNFVAEERGGRHGEPLAHGRLPRRRAPRRTSPATITDKVIRALGGVAIDNQARV